MSVIYPLWLPPLRQSLLPTMHPHSPSEIEADGITLKPFLNIGLCGPGPTSYDDFINVNRDLEQKIKELGGMKWLYAHVYFSEGEFWDLFSREWYDSLREKYNANSFPSAYEKVKVHVDAMNRDDKSTSWRSFLSPWPISGFYGIKKAIDKWLIS